MDALVTGFQKESLKLVGQLLQILESTKPNLGLEQFAQLSDRIMGAAKSLAIATPAYQPALEAIGSCSELAKELAKKTSDASPNQQQLDGVLKLLKELTIVTRQITELLSEPQKSSVNVKELLSEDFLHRLQSVSQELKTNLNSSLASDVDAAQKNLEIEKLLKSFGF